MVERTRTGEDLCMCRVVSCRVTVVSMHLCAYGFVASENIRPEQNGRINTGGQEQILMGSLCNSLEVGRDTRYQVAQGPNLQTVSIPPCCGFHHFYRREMFRTGRSKYHFSPLQNQTEFAT